MSGLRLRNLCSPSLHLSAGRPASQPVSASSFSFSSAAPRRWKLCLLARSPARPPSQARFARFGPPKGPLNCQRSLQGPRLDRCNCSSMRANFHSAAGSKRAEVLAGPKVSCERLFAAPWPVGKFSCSLSLASFMFALPARSAFYFKERRVALNSKLALSSQAKRASRERERERENLIPFN